MTVTPANYIIKLCILTKESLDDDILKILAGAASHRRIRLIVWLTSIPSPWGRWSGLSVGLAQKLKSPVFKRDCGFFVGALFPGLEPGTH